MAVLSAADRPSTVWLAALGFTRRGRRPVMGRPGVGGWAAWAEDGSWWRCGRAWLACPPGWPLLRLAGWR